MLLGKSSFLFIYFLVLPYFVTPKGSPVYEYGSDNFKEKVEGKTGTFVMFYTPWCRQCIEFQPIWDKLGEMVNKRGSKYVIAQVDCAAHSALCQDKDITGYPTLQYFHGSTYAAMQFSGTRDLPTLTLFMNDLYEIDGGKPLDEDLTEVKINKGLALLTDHNIEKYISTGQHFIMFYAPWCPACQRLAPVWSELASTYERNEYIHIGKMDCMENVITCKSNFEIKQYPSLMWIVNGRVSGMSDAETLEDLEKYVELMLLTENHDPEKFMKKKKILPVARISEETFETFLEKDLVFVNYFAPWCAHCMQLSPLWLKLGEKFQNESRVLIADVDCNMSKALCEMEKVGGLPTLILYKYKKIVNVERGGKPLDSLISIVNEHLQEQKPKSRDIIKEEKKTKDEL